MPVPSYSEWATQQDTTSISVDGHDLEVAYYDEGAGDPVIFLHGIPTNSYLWRTVISPIADERRVIVPDMLGYGNSSIFDGFDRSIRAQEAMLEELRTAVDIDQLSVVGHDLGGGVALRYAVHNPDRVEKLVLSNAVCYDSWPIQTITDLGLPKTTTEYEPADIQKMLDDLFRGTLARDEPADGFLDGMKTPWQTEAGMVSLVRNAVATNTNHTTEIDPSEVTAETLLLWGADDELQEIEYAERLDTDIPNTQLTGLHDATHWVMEDQPDAYQEELRVFLLE